MTLEEAGELYNKQQEKLDKVDASLNAISRLIREIDNNPMGYCSPNENELYDIANHLRDYRKHLEFTLKRELILRD